MSRGAARGATLPKAPRRPNGRFHGDHQRDSFGAVSTQHPSPSRRGPLAAALLVAGTIAGLALWTWRESGDRRSIAAGLDAYASSPLPSADAPIDTALSALGARIFRKRCAACHTITGESRAGPDLAGVTSRRDLVWIRHMILAPDSMTEHDSIAAALKARHKIQMMLPGGASPEEARAVIEFLRRVDRGLEG